MKWEQKKGNDFLKEHNFLKKRKMQTIAPLCALIGGLFFEKAKKNGDQALMKREQKKGS